MKKTPILTTFFLTILSLTACGDSISQTARNGFPGTDQGGDIFDCSDIRRTFEGTQAGGSGYFFGEIVSVEPILDGVRLNTSQRNTYLDETTYSCSDYGLAALRMTFTNVEASWDESLDTLEVLFRAESFLDLNTSPQIDPRTHELVWSTDGNTRARFPGKGTRLGAWVRGSTNGSIVGSFSDVLEVHRDGTVTMHYGRPCADFDAERFSTEKAVLEQLRGLDDASDLDFSQDLQWYVTSVCEYP